jgi:hypothetical protein
MKEGFLLVYVLSTNNIYFPGKNVKKKKIKLKKYYTRIKIRKK